MGKYMDKFPDMMSAFETQERRFVLTVFRKNEYFHIVAGTNSIMHPDVVKERAKEYAVQSNLGEINWAAVDCCGLHEKYWERYQAPDFFI